MKKTFQTIILICFMFAAGNAQNIGIGNINPRAKLDINGDFAIRLQQITLNPGANNNVDLTANPSVYYQVVGPGNKSVSGFNSGVDGKIITLYNYTGLPITFLHNDPGSLLNSQISISTGNNLILNDGGMITLFYHSIQQKWLVVSSTNGNASNAIEWKTTGNSNTVPGNSYIGTSDANDVVFKANNTEVMRFNNATSNVGIGTTTATDKFTVRTAPNNWGITHTDGSVILSTYAGTTGGWLGTRSNHPLYLFSNGLPQATVLPNGNFGIGTTNPGTLLTVNTNGSGFGITHTDGSAKLSTYIGQGGAWFGTTTNTPLILYTNNSAQGILTTTGKLGIGTLNPMDAVTIQTTAFAYGLTHTDGTVSISTSTDGTQGFIGTQSNHPINLMTNGLQCLTVLPNGNVGISATTPQEKLVISTATSKYGWLHSDGNVLFGSYVSPAGGAVGTKSGHPFFLMTNGVTQATLLFNGNFGVGTTNPAEKLTVQTAANSYGFLQTNGSVSLGTFASSASGSIGTKSNHPLGFFTNNGAQQMTLLQNGNIGLGTATPQVELHVNPAGTGSMLIGTNKTSGGYTCLEAGISAQSAGHAYLQSTKSSGTSYGALLLNPYGGNVGINHSDNTFLYPLDINQRGLFGMILHNTTSGDAWEMYTEGSGTGGFLTFSKNNSLTAQIANNGAYIQVSDARFKKNISGLKSVLSKVLLLKPKEYEYINNNPGNERSIGFIAQDVLSLFPTLTAEIKHPQKDEKDNTSYYGVNYAGFSVIAIKAIQEQQQIINDLQKQIDELRKMVEKNSAKSH